MSTGTLFLLFGAGILAGLCGAIGGLASLASYPALLIAGLAPAAANVTNTVALVATTLGSGLGSRPELAGQGRRIAKLCAISTVGGAGGAVLLLTTPPGVFARVVPWLVGGASLVLLLAPWLRRVAGRLRGHPAVVALFLVSGYSGYFGAAAGVLMLALLSATSDEPLARVNAAKNLVTGASNAVAAVIFALIGPVAWPAAGVMAVGALIGSRLGPPVVRRLPAGPLRIGIAVAGLGLAVKLAL